MLIIVEEGWLGDGWLPALAHQLKVQPPHLERMADDVSRDSCSKPGNENVRRTCLALLLKIVI